VDETYLIDKGRIVCTSVHVNSTVCCLIWSQLYIYMYCSRPECKFQSFGFLAIAEIETHFSLYSPYILSPSWSLPSLHNIISPPSNFFCPPLLHRIRSHPRDFTLFVTQFAFFPHTVGPFTMAEFTLLHHFRGNYRVTLGIRGYHRLPFVFQRYYPFSITQLVLFVRSLSQNLFLLLKQLFLALVSLKNVQENVVQNYFRSHDKETVN
jgi:hypothetical protein